MTTLEDLYVYYCRRTDCKPNSDFRSVMREAFDASHGSRNLHTIDVSRNYVGPRGIEPVLELARNVYSLRCLDLRNNMLEHADVEKLMRAVCRHPNIQTINLSFNKIHDSSTANLLHLLQTNTNIIELMLDGCDFTVSSKTRIEDQLNENRRAWRERCAEVGADEAENPTKVASRGPTYTPYRSECSGIITKATSGGHFHYASWRKNPQFSLYLTKEATVTVTLRVKDVAATRPMGFAVLKGHALLRVVHIEAADILAESPFDDTVTSVQLRLQAAEKTKNSAPYVVVPFTFQPGRPAEFSFSAEIPPEVDGIVTLQPLESRFDWVTTEVQGEWTVDTSGGSMGCPTWRDNDGFRVKYEGPVSNGQATLYMVLSKANDSDDNDDREIGLYVLKPDRKGRLPVRTDPDTVMHTLDHTQSTSPSLKFDISCGSLDLVVVPTTRLPNQLGTYTLMIFSTCELNVTRTIHPHGWAHQQLDGEWDERRNGGSRKDNPSTWVHNPCYEFTNNSGHDIDVCLALERAPVAPSLVSEKTDGVVATTSDDEPKQPLRPRPPVDIGIMLLKPDNDLSIVSITGWVSAKETTLYINDLPVGTYFLVPLTRRAGHHDLYRIRTYSSTSVHVSLEIPLAVRLREKQLKRYSEENEARRQRLRGEAKSAASMTELLETARAEQNFDDYDTAAKEKNEAVQRYLRDGTLFVDRDFPRGTSSLWLDPDVAPADSPPIHRWCRPSEIMPNKELTFAPGCALAGSIPHGFNVEWFHSALGAVSTRPELLAKLIGGYHPEYGVAQFHFFKSGLWRSVTIDDFLICDAMGDLCFSRSVDPNDVFVPLVEKAYAKLHRCYNALDAPHTALNEALTDLTGGLVFTHTLYGNAGRAWSQKSLWSHLMRCREKNELMSLCLTPETPAAEEKKYGGIHIGRLYTVIDARDVEGNKLVKLHNFWGVEEVVWRGKWSSTSSLWTSTIKKAVDYETRKDSFWVSLEEVIYYFGKLLRVELPNHTAWVEGGFSGDSTGGSLLDPTWINNPQYRLSVHTDKPTKVYLGLHRPDDRMALLREEGSLPSYTAELGLSVIRTTDATRRLMSITDTELPTTMQAAARRDGYIAVDVEPGYDYVLMPFCLSPKVSAQYFISAYSEMPVAMTMIAGDMNISIEGKWEGPTAGGPPGMGSWRNNPQFLLYPSEDTQATIVLRQRNDLNSTTEHIGFTVLKAHDIRRTLHCPEEDIVLQVPHNNDHAVVGTVRVEGMTRRRGMPYVIVPSTSTFGAETGFTLEVVSNRKMQLKPIDKETDWCTVVRRETFSFTEGTAGGSMQYSSWRNNPQFALSFPTERSGSLLVVASNDDPNSTEPIGLMVMKSDTWDHGRRRKLQCTKQEILAESEERSGYCELSMRYQVKKEPLILMPFTTMPMTEVKFTLSVYCTSDVNVEPVREWNQYSVEGKWELGLTAGGNRHANRSWLNNPFFSLNLTKPTRLVILGLQYPIGPQKQIVRRVGKNRVFLPPPIVNEGNKVCFGIDVVESNEHNTHIAATKHTYDGEVSMLQSLPPCATTPYFLVPHTFDPEQEADFKLVVYADEPIQLEQHRKPRRYY